MISSILHIIEVEPVENITILENIYSAHKDRLAIEYKTTKHLDTYLTVVNILGDQITIPYTLKLNENNIYDLIYTEMVKCLKQLN